MRLGLFIQIEDPKMWLVVSGALAAARQQKARLVVYAGPTEAGHQTLDRRVIETCYNFSRQTHQGAILAFAPQKALAYAQDLWSQGHPTMLVGRRAGMVPFTANNHQETMRQAVHMLVEKGHQQIAFIGGPSSNMSAGEKHAGYMQGLAQHAIDFDPRLVIAGDYTQETARTATTAALRAGVQFTALIASNDLGAIGAMEALREAGLAPGGDVEVLGFDNIPQSHWTQPPLSTHDPHYYQMGHRACTELACCVSKRNYIVSAIVPAAYIPRESTWEPAADNEMDHPLNADWVENRFSYEAQLTLLKESPAAPLLEQLTGAMESKESFLQTMREVLLEAQQLGLSAGCLFPVLHGCMRAAGGKHQAGERVKGLLREAAALQTTMLFDEQRRTTERSTRFGIANNELRQLSLSNAREEGVIDCLGRTIRSLGIAHAALFLHDRPARIGEEQGGPGRWIAWNGGGKRSSSHVEGFQLSHFAEAPDSIVYLPLLENDELFGIMLLEADNEFLVHYGVLARQFSSALRAARLQRDLARASAELVETSRLAGLAEMATGVLHNIGNALNGVNTNCSLMAERLRHSKTPSVGRVAELLLKHEADLGDFLTQDPRGRQVPGFLTQLAAQLTAEQKNLDDDLRELSAMVDHINEIVAAQQSYAQISGLVEELQATELIEFAVRLGEASLTRHGVVVERHYEDVSDIRIQRQKAVQILVNLIRNAKESMDEQRPATKVLSLGVRPGAPGRVLIEVRDNGTGIAPENLTRIFGFGFTTKPGGHGFGLHNSALAAKEMDGRLSLASDGPGLGATFTLDLPAAGSPKR